MFKKNKIEISISRLEKKIEKIIQKIDSKKCYSKLIEKNSTKK